ncbi:MAG: hypothetical protein MRY79_00300 [Alphaproteobacteria bacterium]|nr:hypothetical protein [Alphaproteobacteria bacterium]
MKKLIIMRHGDNVGHLTKAGISSIFNVAGKIGGADVKIDAILHSPTDRTTETAHVVAESIMHHGGACPEILVDSSLHHGIPDLSKLKDKWDTVCLVSHMPNIDSMTWSYPLLGRLSVEEGDANLLTFDAGNWKNVSRSAPTDKLFLRADNDSFQKKLMTSL